MVRARIRMATSDDWNALAYVLIVGLATLIQPGADGHARAVELLRSKYAQYRAMRMDQRLIIQITPTRIKRWTFAE